MRKIATTVAALMIGTAASAGTFTVESVDFETAVEFEQAVERGDEIILNTMGGQVDAAHMMMRVIREHQPKMTIPSDGNCLSACTMLMSASTNLIVEDGATVAIHFIYAPAGEQNKVTIMWQSTADEWYQLTGSDTMFAEYVNFMLESGMITEENIGENFTKYHVTKGGNWTQLAFMYLDETQMKQFGLLK